MIGRSRALAARPLRRARATVRFDASGDLFQNPAGQRATTALAPPWRAHSIEVQPPREIPATAGLPSIPSDSKKSSTAVARLAARGSTPSGSSRRLPEPGHVDRDHLALRREPVHHGRPLNQRSAKRMEQEQRFPSPCLT